MGYPLLSIDWIEHYLQLWNDNEDAVEGTKGMPALVEFVVTDQDRPPVHFNVTESGVADYAGPMLEGREPFFRLSAPTETWRKVAQGEIGVKRAVTGPIAFQGSLLKALKHFRGLEAALLQFGAVPTLEWEAP